jgi:hypothetical protein
LELVERHLAPFGLAESTSGPTALAIFEMSGSNCRRRCPRPRKRRIFRDTTENFRREIFPTEERKRKAFPECLFDNLAQPTFLIFFNLDKVGLTFKVNGQNLKMNFKLNKHPFLNFRSLIVETQEIKIVEHFCANLFKLLQE